MADGREWGSYTAVAMEVTAVAEHLDGAVRALERKAAARERKKVPGALAFRNQVSKVLHDFNLLFLAEVTTKARHLPDLCHDAQCRCGPTANL